MVDRERKKDRIEGERFFFLMQRTFCFRREKNSANSIMKKKNAYLERKGSKGRESLIESEKEVGLGAKERTLNRSEEAKVETKVCPSQILRRRLGTVALLRLHRNQPTS